MPLRQARTVDEIATLVQGYDRVLTTDPPLALALNRRIETAQLGRFAATPKNHARQRHETIDRRDLFHRIATETELPWKRAAPLLDTCLRCWEDTGQRDAILTYDRYNTPQTRQIVNLLATEPSTHRARERVTIDPSENTAVIDLDAFTALDRAVLPDDQANIDTIDPVHPNRTAPPPPFHVLPSTPSIIRTLQAHITPQNADDIGIVVDPGSPIRPLVEAMLEAQRIPYSTEDVLDEDPQLRAFLRLLRLGLSRERVKGRHVRGVLATIGLSTPERDDEKYLDALTTANAPQLHRFFDDLQDAPLHEALQAFESLADASLTSARETFDDLGILHEPLDRTLLDAIGYYLDTFRIREDYTRTGTLLASAHQNATIDRPLVFHLGLDAGWNRPLPTDPWLTAQDQQARETNDLNRFERLLQAGARSIALVQDTRQGKPVAPCFALHELLDTDFQRFSQIPTAQRSRAPLSEPTDATTSGFAHDPVEDADPITLETLSTTALDQLARSPRAWYMDQLIPTKRAEPLQRGRILHDFAEFYAAHPEAVNLDDPDDRETLIQVALDEIDPYLDTDDQPPRATELALGLRMIARWLDENPPTGDPPDGYKDPPPERRGWSQNPFAKAYDLTLEASAAERWFTDAALGLHGKVDLIQATDHLVDWKTGKNPSSLARTLRQARPGSDEDPPRFQPAAYLAYHRTQTPNTPLTFTYVDLLSCTTDLIKGQATLEDLERRIPYFPHSHTEHLATREAFDYLTSSSQKRKDVFETLGYERYRRHMERHGPPPLTDKETAASSTFADTLTDLAIQHRGAEKKSERAVRGAMKKLVELPETALFKEDLDTFERYIGAMLDAVNQWLSTRFPLGDTDPRDTHHEDVLLTRLGPPPGGPPSPIPQPTEGSDA